jgi:hypothetical protein
VPGTRLKLTEPYVTLAYAVAGRLLSITRIPLSPAAADCVVVHVAAAGSTTVVVVESTDSVSARALQVNRLKNPLRLRWIVL